MMTSGRWPIPHSARAVREMQQHASYYFPVDRAKRFSRLRSTSEAVRLSELPRVNPPKRLQHCASALARSGIRVAVVDVTSPDIELGPFRVVRAVSADLQPISFGYRMERRPVARLSAGQAKQRRTDIQPIW
jgi:hypothetical protein